MTVKEVYAKVGANYDEVVRRLMKESLVYKFLKQFIEEDDTYTQLEKNMAEGNVELSFRAAHTLKGVALNLGLVNLAEPVSELAEDLRAGGSDKAAELFVRTQEQYRLIADAVAQMEEAQ